MKTLIVFLGLLAACRGQYIFCMVSQWEGYQGTFGSVWENGSPVIFEEFQRVAYDLNNTRLALFTSGKKGGTEYKVDHIYDYPKGVLYIIEGSKCVKSKLTAPFERECLPDDAELLWGKTWLGGAGPNEVLWILGFRGTLNGINYHFSMSQFPFLPVMETYTGHMDGKPFYQNSIFMNTTVGIKDPSIFVPPASCDDVEIQMNATIPRHSPSLIF